MPLDAVIVLPGNQIPTKVFDVPESATVPAVLAEAPLRNLMPAPVLLVPPMLRLPPLPAVRLELPENWTPMPLELLPVIVPVPVPAPTEMLAPFSVTADPLPALGALIERLPPLVARLSLVREIAPVPLLATSAVRVIGCACVVIEAPEAPVIEVPARSVMEPAELPVPVASAPFKLTIPEPAGD